MITYDAVASTLRPEIRDAIELAVVQATPCIHPGPHVWDFDGVEIARWGTTEVQRRGEYRCVLCGTTSRVDPVNPTIRNEPPWVSRAEIDELAASVVRLNGSGR